MTDAISIPQPAAPRPQTHGVSFADAAVVGVILNLAVWFSIHTMVREVRPLRAFGIGFEAPVLSSINIWATLLSAAAVIAVLRFKAGMLPTLAACSLAGVVLYLVGA